MKFVDLSEVDSFLTCLNQLEHQIGCKIDECTSEIIEMSFQDPSKKYIIGYLICDALKWFFWITDVVHPAHTIDQFSGMAEMKVRLNKLKALTEKMDLSPY